MGILWTVTIIGGLLLTGMGFSHSNTAGIVSGIGVVAFWIALGGILSHVFGLQRKIKAHLGRAWAKGETVVHEVPVRERPNVHLALEAIRRASPTDLEPLGLEGRAAYRADDFDEVEEPLETGFSLIAILAGNPKPVPLRYTRLPFAHGETRHIPVNVLYRLSLPGGKRVAFVAHLWSRRLEIFAADADLAQQALEHVLEQASAFSVYRGHVISLRPPQKDNDSDDYRIEFHDAPDVSRDAIILPSNVMDMIDRNVTGVLRHAERLREAGCSTRHGVLFYGPPGTGKSLVVKHLCGAIPDLTVVLLTGRQLELIRESCRLARLVAPCLVVLEDVDLIATDRQQSRDTTLLHDLMDEMDGLGPQSDVVFLLTTNRPEVLERALTARPGRIDQAIHFCLPGPGDRRRLLQHFTRGVDVDGVEFDDLIQRTEGASPAFLEELVRRAILFAIERTEPMNRQQVSGADFHDAIRELVEEGGPLTRQLLGFQAS